MTTPPPGLRFSAKRALTYGLPFGTLFALSIAVLEDRPSRLWIVVINALVAGAVFGILMERMSRPRIALAQQRVAEFTAGLSPAARRFALVASRRGPVPAEPAIQTAALRIATERLGQLDKHRVGNIIGPALLSVLTAVLALSASSVWWVGTALTVVILVLSAWQRRQARHRHALLADA